MKYYNSETKEWYTEGESITRNIGEDGLFSGVPSAEQLAAWGFEPYVPPTPTPEELLEQAKQEKVWEIEEYDNSDAVNGFTVVIPATDPQDTVEIDTWIDRETRADYKNSLDAAELLGRTEVTPVFNGVPLTLDIQIAKMALAQIQIYANQCYNVTEQHKAAVNALTDIEDVEAFDVTAGYPEKLRFTV